MTYREEDKARMRRQVSKQAIALAMQGRWREVVVANQNLVESFPDDIDAYNRLGRAYMELGEYAQAKEAYSKAIAIDPYNSIAQKNLDRLALLGKSAKATKAAAAHGAGAQVRKVEPTQFIKEVGKAGVVNLLSMARPQVLAKMVAGAPLNLKIDGTNLVVENGLGEYVGQVDPRHGQRLIKLMEGGNRYSAAVVSSTAEGKVTVMIREIYQDPSQAGRLSFPPREGAETTQWTPAGDRMVRRELEYEESLPGDPGFTIVGGEEGEESEVFFEETEAEEENEE